MRANRKRRKHPKGKGICSPLLGESQMSGKDDRQREAILSRIVVEGGAAIECGDYRAINSPQDLDEFFRRVRSASRKIVDGTKTPATKKERDG